MPDERRDSISQGMGVPEESPSGKEAERERLLPGKEAERERLLRAGEAPELGGGLGGTSDADSAGDEAAFEARRHDGGRRAGWHRGPGEGAD